MPGARRVLPALALLAMALPPGPVRAAEAGDVVVSDNFYLPATVTVQEGSTVTWVHQGDLPHTVSADDDSFDSHPACTPAIQGSCMERGDTYSRAFPETGTFGYFCRLHAGMTGTVKVVEPGFVAPTEILDLRATRSGSNLRVVGAAAFGGISSLEVGSDPTDDGAQGLPAVFGLDLTKASIGQPDPRTGDLSFIIDAADLPPTGGIPELAQYFWDFGITKDGRTEFFAVVGQNTDAANGTRVPSFYLTSCDGASCSEPADNPISAVMDGTANRITVTVPKSRLEQLGNMDIAGAEVGRGANYFDGAAARLVVASNQPGPDFDRVPVTGTYTVGHREVLVGLVPAGATPSYNSSAQIADNGAFNASLDVSGLASGAYDLVAKACFGSNCATSSTRVTV